MPSPTRDVAQDVPRLTTERLVIRAHRIEDLGDCAAMWADPEITRHIGGKTFSKEEVWSKLLRHAGHWALMGYGYWLIEDKVSHQFIGEVGFANLKREMEASFEAAPEIGWALARSEHMKGYATEAVHAAVAWGEAHFGAVKTMCMIGPGNAPSIRVAEKCGYKEFQRTTYKGEPTVLFYR